MSAVTDHPDYLRVAQQYGIDADALRREWAEQSHPTLEAAAEAVRQLDQTITTVAEVWAARYVARHRAARRARLPWFLRWLA